MPISLPYKLSATQSVMKRCYDRSAAVPRNFQVGDKVLVLLPVTGSALSAKFCGPYEIHDRLSDTDDVISTPDKRRKTRVCNVNILNAYFSRGSSNGSAKSDSPQVPAVHSSVMPLVHRQMTD